MYHVDRKLDISNRLSAWATEVSQPYLQRFAPQHLALNTIETSWKDYILGDHDVMAIDSNQWTTVGTKKKTHRSNSPPLIHGGGAVPTENVQLNSISVAGHPGSTTASDPHGNVTFASTSGSVSFYNDDDSTTVPTEKGKIKDTILFSDRSTTSDTTATAGKQSALHLI
ncbi:hypothetical protein MHU86_9090 [Fragilaria crotonensis]|nr:hypothetical protein MHU86_9090 [Fragilaria crotonensis]